MSGQNAIGKNLMVGQMIIRHYIWMQELIQLKVAIELITMLSNI
jgi:hypothetical protein